MANGRPPSCAIDHSIEPGRSSLLTPTPAELTTACVEGLDQLKRRPLWWGCSSSGSAGNPPAGAEPLALVARRRRFMARPRYQARRARGREICA